MRQSSYGGSRALTGLAIPGLGNLDLFQQVKHALQLPLGYHHQSLAAHVGHCRCHPAN